MARIPRALGALWRNRKVRGKLRRHSRGNTSGHPINGPRHPSLSGKFGTDPRRVSWRTSRVHDPHTYAMRAASLAVVAVIEWFIKRLLGRYHHLVTYKPASQSKGLEHG